MKITSIVMDVPVQRNYLNLLQNEMDIVYILNIKYKKNDSFCARYCLYIIYLTKVLGIGFKSAVLNLYHQRFF